MPCRMFEVCRIGGVACEGYFDCMHGREERFTGALVLLLKKGFFIFIFIFIKL